MLDLYVPQVEDLWFREWMLGDAQTMAYNHSYGGTIAFPKDRWHDWYCRWVNPRNRQRFYRYLTDGAVTLFLSCGFTEIQRTAEAIWVKKDLTAGKNVL